MYRLFLISTILLSGCMVSNSLEYLAVSDSNINRLSKIEKGMSQREVMAIMHKPFKFEIFTFGKDIYDVWFYVTRTTVMDQSRMVPQNLTPLTFKNGILVGKGYDYYNYLVQVEENPPKPAVKEKPAEENEGLEKALQAPPTATTAMSRSPQKPEEEHEQRVGEWDQDAEEMEQDEEEQDFNFW